MSFFRWWGRTLWATLPRPVQSALAFRQRGPAVRLHLTTDGVLSGGEEHEGPADHAPATLIVEAGLSREVQLPAAAEGNLQQVLGHQIDELTPYRADQVYLGAQVMAKKAGQLTARMAVATRAVVDEALREASARGFRVKQVVLDQSGNPIALAVPGHKGPRRRGIVTQLRAAHVVLIALAAALLLPLAEKTWHLRSLEQELEDQRASFRGSVGTAADTGDIATARDILVTEDGTYPPRINTLAALTEALSDGTWLTSLSIEGTAVEMTGTTRDPSTVLARLGRSAGFASPQFSAPVSRAGTEGLNDFRIATQVVHQKDTAP